MNKHLTIIIKRMRWRKKCDIQHLNEEGTSEMDRPSINYSIFLQIARFPASSFLIVHYFSLAFLLFKFNSKLQLDTTHIFSRVADDDNASFPSFPSLFISICFAAAAAWRKKFSNANVSNGKLVHLK